MGRKAKAKYGLVYSFQDLAGEGIASKILSRGGWSECSIEWPGSKCWRRGETVLAGFREDDIYFDFLDEVLDVEAYIVLSRHSSSSGTPTLSIHHTGNPGPSADYGGRPRELSWVYPRLSKALFLNYYYEAEKRRLLERYVFTLEATHHGPTGLSKPLVFIEIGSSEEQWSDTIAQEAAAEAVLSTISLEKMPDCFPVVGVGGTHYPEKHTKLMLRDRYCYGHIFAKYVLQYLDEDILEQAVSKSVDRVRAIVVLKVPSRVKQLVKSFAAARGLEVKQYK